MLSVGKAADHQWRGKRTVIEEEGGEGARKSLAVRGKRLRHGHVKRLVIAGVS